MSYYRDVYLKSEQWKEFKRLKSRTSIRRCAICGSRQNIDLHHLFYRPNLEDVETSDVRWLCRRCHDRTHELISSGQLKFKDGANHQSMFCLTRNRVRASFDEVKLRIDNQCDMAKRIDALRTGVAGWTRKSLESLGVPWPPRKGWRKDLIRKSMQETNNVKRFGH